MRTPRARHIEQGSCQRDGLVRADILRLRGDWAGCRQGLHEALTLARDAGLTLAAAVLATLLADTALLMGDTEAAITLGEQLVAQLRAMPLLSQLGRALGNLCGAYLMAGNTPARSTRPPKLGRGCDAKGCTAICSTTSLPRKAVSSVPRVCWG